MWARMQGGDWVVTRGYLAIGCPNGDNTRRTHWWCVNSCTTGMTTTPSSSFRMVGATRAIRLWCQGGGCPLGTRGGVDIGPGRCASSDELRGRERQPRRRFAWQGPSVSMGASSNACLEAAGMWFGVGGSARLFAFVR